MAEISVLNNQLTSIFSRLNNISNTNTNFNSLMVTVELNKTNKSLTQLVDIFKKTNDLFEDGVIKTQKNIFESLSNVEKILTDNKEQKNAFKSLSNIEKILTDYCDKTDKKTQKKETIQEMQPAPFSKKDVEKPEKEAASLGIALAKRIGISLGEDVTKLLSKKAQEKDSFNVFDRLKGFTTGEDVTKLLSKKAQEKDSFNVFDRLKGFTTGEGVAKLLSKKAQEKDSFNVFDRLKGFTTGEDAAKSLSKKAQDVSGGLNEKDKLSLGTSIAGIFSIIASKYKFTNLNDRSDRNMADMIAAPFKLLKGALLNPIMGIFKGIMSLVNIVSMLFGVSSAAALQYVAIAVGILAAIWEVGFLIRKFMYSFALTRGAGASALGLNEEGKFKITEKRKVGDAVITKDNKIIETDKNDNIVATQNNIKVESEKNKPQQKQPDILNMTDFTKVATKETDKQKDNLPNILYSILNAGRERDLLVVKAIDTMKQEMSKKLEKISNFNEKNIELQEKIYNANRKISEKEFEEIKSYSVAPASTPTSTPEQ